jgi:D-aminoacyl-tRNA deacylase
MKIVLQKVKRGMVDIDGVIVGEIAEGYVLLVGIAHGDTLQHAKELVDKILKIKLFSEEGSQTFMEKNIIEVHGGILVISQFTLYADCSKGTKPSFTDAANAEIAKPLYAYIVKLLQESGLRVETGAFGEHMEVELINDGPITILLES